MHLVLTLAQVGGRVPTFCHAHTCANAFPSCTANNAPPTPCCVGTNDVDARLEVDVLKACKGAADRRSCVCIAGAEAALPGFEDDDASPEQLLSMIS